MKIHFRGDKPVSKVLRSGDLELDRTRCIVRRGSEELTLTATEFRLLEFLMSRPGVVFSREQLLDAVWGHDRAVTDRTVDVYVLRLRQKIEQEGGPPPFCSHMRTRKSISSVRMPPYISGSRTSDFTSQ